MAVLQELPGVDCGDPRVLTEFIQWGIRLFPAHKYLVDIWNHGGGWENLPSDYDYEAMRRRGPIKSAQLKRAKKSIFRTTIHEILRRPHEARTIAIDCGAHDYLDNQDLRTAVLNALPNGRKLDILACDACLMNMFEISYEMRNTTEFMVGSEETEPAAGWPYDKILSALTLNSQMSARDLSVLIVNEYGKYYSSAANIATQSCLDFSAMESAAKATNALADALLNELPHVAGAISLARSRAQKFEMPEYIDLADFAAKLRERTPHSPKICAAIDGLEQVLRWGACPFVAQNAKVGARVAGATGVSIYFPESGITYLRDYADLQFSKEGKWKVFLDEYFNV